MTARTNKKAKKVKHKARRGKSSVARRASHKPKGKASKSRPAKRPKPAKGKSKADALRLKKAKERERAQKERQRERERLEKEREKARLQKEREREKALKEREREKALKEREREKALKEREREKDKKEREKLREREQKEREKQRERELKEREKARAQAKKEQEAEKARKAAEKEAARKAKEDERARLRDEAKRKRDEERAAREAEREAQREAARRAKDEERARREAEREAYRKAKEVERERLRAEKEAARRLLEGKVARATKRAQRAAGGRSSSTRVYRPDAIPDQSGTTRKLHPGEEPPRPVPPRPIAAPPPLPPPPPPPPAPPKEPLPETIEDRWSVVVKRLAETDQAFQNEYRESFDMSWIYHDSALEGVVYTYQELKTAIDPTITVVPDSSLQPVCEEIRRHKQAIELVRELGEKKRAPISVDTIKKIYLTLHPEEGDLKSVKYRKDIPQHRLYFHEYAPPDKIAYKVRQVIDWLNGPEPKKIKHPIRIAARVHFDLLRVFPFPVDSGKVARLLMSVILLRSGFPPAIVHSTERQRYYEALKSSLPTLVAMVTEAINNGLQSIEKRLDERDSRIRSFTG